MPSNVYGPEAAHVIIIGGGASGVLLACHLLRDSASALRVTLIEKRSEVGRGIAYSTANPGHLLNARAENMSAFPDEPDHFWQWLTAQKQHPARAAYIENCNDPFCFVPRQIYGDYISGLIEPLMAKDRHTAGLHIIQGECTSLVETRSGVAITLADGRRWEADLAVVATGHEAPAPCTGCQADPWTSPATAGIEKDAPVFIMGTGLTMVDYVLSLILAGHHGPIIAMSRRGLLPHAHRRVKAVQIQEAEIPFGAGVTALLRWLRRRIEAHATLGGDWRGVIDGLRPFNQRIWQALSTADRRRFVEHTRAWWDVHRHRMAPAAAKQIFAALTGGQLRVIAGKICSIEPGCSGATIHYRRRGHTQVETLRTAKIVECRMVVAVPPTTTNPLLRDLFDSGLARHDPLCIGLDVTADGALIDRRGTPSERIFAVGPITRAAFWEIVAVPDIRTQCAKLAAKILSHPWRDQAAGAQGYSHQLPLQ